MSKVSVVKGVERRNNIIRALDPLTGEIDRLIEKKGSGWLFIKVNAIDINFPLAVTSPEALEAVLEVFYDRFERITIGDNSFVFSRFPDSNTYTPLRSRFRKVEFSDLSPFPTKTITFQCLDVNRAAKVSLLPEKAFTISLSLPKTHDYYVFTGCAKNMVGCVVENRKWMHGVMPHERILLKRVVRSNKLANQNLVTVIRNARADLNVLDGYRAMEGDGPLFGDGVNLGLAIVGNDAIAVDSLAARIAGFRNVPYLRMCAEEGLGNATGIKVVMDGFEKLEEVSTRLRPHRLTPYQLMMDERPNIPSVDVKYLLGVLKRTHRLKDTILEVLR